MRCIKQEATHHLGGKHESKSSKGYAHRDREFSRAEHILVDEGHKQPDTEQCEDRPEDKQRLVVGKNRSDAICSSTSFCAQICRIQGDHDQMDAH